MLYKISNLTVSLGGKEILSHVDFEIRGTEKIAVTGRNGAGKTTLLRFIAGEIEADRDDRRTGPAVETARTVTIGMMSQTSAEYEGLTVREMCGGADNASEWEFDRLFTGFGFEKTQKDRPFVSFSGGERTKISMIRLLLSKPDILLLDEPTNHLDLKTVEWLEEYLRTYPKAVVFVSHDRFFTDRAADAVYELENGRLTRYAGNYTQFRAQKQKNRELALRAWERNRQEVERLGALIEKFKNKPRKAAFARSRKSILERMEKLEKPSEDTAHIFTGPIEPEDPGAKWVVDAEHLKCGYGSTGIVELSFKLRRGQKTAIIGDNGTGKSTFLKTVAGRLKALGGKCTLGNRISIGYFDQMSAGIESELTVAEHFAECFPLMDARELRNTLASYLFRGADVMKKVSLLSGGEKARLVLAELLTQRYNFLILDEPTNHMDIEARETLESAFEAYTGAILFVSHDRYLVSRLADSFYIFDGGRALYYPFDYGHYLERLGRPDIAGLVSAEDEAMIEGLKSVPKKEHHEIHFRNTEEAREDWRMRLANERLLEARRAVGEAGNEDEYTAALQALSEAETDWYITLCECDYLSGTDSEEPSSI